MNLDKITQRYLDFFQEIFQEILYKDKRPISFCTYRYLWIQKAQLLHFNENLAEEIGFGKIENQEDTDF